MNLEVMSGYDDIAQDIIASRNSVCQVRDSAIYYLEGVFKELRDELRKARIDHLIAFKQNEQNETKPLNVEEVVALATLFHPQHSDGVTHPTRSYSSKGYCAEAYAAEWRAQQEDRNKRKTEEYNPQLWANGFGKILKCVPDILKLAEDIEVELDLAYRRVGGLNAIKNADEGAEKEVKSKGRSGALRELGGPRKLPLTGQRVGAGWPAGYLYPVISAARPLLDYSDRA